MYVGHDAADHQQNPGFQNQQRDARPDFQRGDAQTQLPSTFQSQPRSDFRQRGGDGYRGQQGWSNDGRGYDNGYRGNYRDYDNRNWSRDWRNNGRYNWQSYRTYNRDIFRLPRYYAPSGWGYGYQRFGIGFTLSSLLFDRSYWIDDPEYYRLPPVYGPYEWVRYYNDALLVDIRSGYVVDVVYDIFW